MAQNFANSIKMYKLQVTLVPLIVKQPQGQTAKVYQLQSQTAAKSVTTTVTVETAGPTHKNTEPNQKIYKSAKLPSYQAAKLQMSERREFISSQQCK